MYLYSLININLFLFAYLQNYGFAYFLASEFLRIFYYQGFHDTFVLSGLCFGEIILYAASFVGYMIYMDFSSQMKNNNSNIKIESIIENE